MLLVCLSLCFSFLLLLRQGPSKGCNIVVEEKKFVTLNAFMLCIFMRDMIAYFTINVFFDDSEKKQPIWYANQHFIIPKYDFFYIFLYTNPAPPLPPSLPPPPPPPPHQPKNMAVGINFIYYKYFLGAIFTLDHHRDILSTSIINKLNLFQMLLYNTIKCFVYIFQFCAALRYFATGASYSTISDYQGISTSTLSRAIHEVLDFLGSITHEYIVWPYYQVQMQQNSAIFLEKSGKPHTAGVIDGTHVAVRRVLGDDEAAYVNRKLYHSINVLVGNNIFTSLPALVIT